MNKLTVKERHKQKAEQEQKLRQALQNARASGKKSKSLAGDRKDVSQLFRFIAIPITHARAVRDASTFQPRGYSQSRQIVALVDHLFRLYPAPQFLYRALLTREGEMEVFGSHSRHRWVRPSDTSLFREIALAALQGRSVAQAAKGELTKREAHLLLQAPDHLELGAAVFWAKAAAAGVPKVWLDRVTVDFGGGDPRAISAARTCELLHFLAGALPQATPENYAFAVMVLKAGFEDPRFSLKGRTLASLLKLGREWLRGTRRGSRLFRQWIPYFSPWRMESGTTRIVMQELCSSRAVEEEGHAQQHCVASYVGRCVGSSTRILSLRWHEVQPQGGVVIGQRITLEVDSGSRRIVQARKKHNRRPTVEEAAILREWAEEYGLSFGPYAL